ncbi:MAG TPA: hypothetical protein VE173_07800, partial [Longimicrobiales bacterium]|nr:hypothetical protein [Longimicrobiales bacterium]
MQVADREPLCVIAHLGGDADMADVDLLRRLFLLRQRFWPDGETAHPVNLPASSALRQRFSLEVLGQSVQELAPYWNERYFHGTRPPPTVASQAAVLLFVARTPGGVGYVERPAIAELPDGVRTLLCLSGPGAGQRLPPMAWRAGASYFAPPLTGASPPLRLRGHVERLPP